MVVLLLVSKLWPVKMLSGYFGKPLKKLNMSKKKS